MKPLSTLRIVLAVAVAMLADAIQLPLTAAYGTVIFSVLAFLAIMVVDLLAFTLTVGLLGFHWMLLPSLAAEAIPGLGVLPTWTACVAFVLWSRRKEMGAVETARPAEPALIESTPSPSPPSLTETADLSAASLNRRLESLTFLRNRNLITEEEFNARRSQLLQEL